MHEGLKYIRGYSYLKYLDLIFLLYLTFVWDTRKIVRQVSTFLISSNIYNQIECLKKDIIFNAKSPSESKE